MHEGEELRDGCGKKRAIHDYSLLSPMRDFHGDCPDHCRLFFGFARDLIDRKHLYVLQQNVGLAIGVQQIRGIRSTEPMSAAGMTPPPREANDLSSVRRNIWFGPRTTPARWSRVRSKQGWGGPHLDDTHDLRIVVRNCAKRLRSIRPGHAFC